MQTEMMIVREVFMNTPVVYPNTHKGMGVWLHLQFYITVHFCLAKTKSMLKTIR